MAVVRRLDVGRLAQLLARSLEQHGAAPEQIAAGRHPQRRAGALLDEQDRGAAPAELQQPLDDLPPPSRSIRPRRTCPSGVSSIAWEAVSQR
jgi:hypothetical protein